MITTLEAMNLILTLPIKGASERPCHVINPDLWEVWCEIMKRPNESPTDVWSEIDVASSAESMLRQYIRNCVTGERTE